MFNFKVSFMTSSMRVDFAVRVLATKPDDQPHAYINAMPRLSCSVFEKK